MSINIEGAKTMENFNMMQAKAIVESLKRLHDGRARDLINKYHKDVQRIIDLFESFTEQNYNQFTRERANELMSAMVKVRIPQKPNDLRKLEQQAVDCINKVLQTPIERPPRNIRRGPAVIKPFRLSGDTGAAGDEETGTSDWIKGAKAGVDERTGTIRAAEAAAKPPKISWWKKILGGK